MNAAIIGLACRYWPGAFAERLRTFPEVTLAAASSCERDDATIQAGLGYTKEEFAIRYGTTLYADPRTMIEAVRPDAVLICEESAHQFRYAKLAAESGLPFFIAKPMATSLATAKRIADAAQRANVIATTGSTQRFDGALREVAERIRRDEIGEVLSIRVMHQHGNISAFGPDDWYRKTENGGPELSLLWYAIDCLRWLTGKEVASVYAQYDNFTWPDSRFFDTGKVIVRFADGTLGSIDVYFCMRWRYPSWEVEIVGQRGALKTTQSTFEGALYTPESVSSFYRLQNDHLAAELRHWLGAVEGKWAPEVPLADACRTLEVCLACLKSAREGRVITLPLDPSEVVVADRDAYARGGR